MSVRGAKRAGSAVISNTIDVERPATEVFDYCSDMRTEADWNPVATSVTMISPGPVSKGSRFTAAFSGLGRSTAEIVEFARPSSWTTETIEATLPFRLIGTVTPSTAGSARLTMRIELLPTGGMRLLVPLIKIMMQRTAKANLRRIKAAVERYPDGQGGPAPAREPVGHADWL